MISSEDVLFIMPRDRELQFPAMAGLQRWVNDYEQKMQANCVTLEVPRYHLRYWADMPDDDWRFFHALGVELSKDREQIGYPDAVIDMGDDRIRAFYNSAIHCGQVISGLCGVETPPMPKVRQIDCGLFDGVVVIIDCADAVRSALLNTGIGSVLWDDVMLLHRASSAEGASTTPVVVGSQSRVTYAAASLGLPVIEILQKDRSVNWLSKFKNPLYRLVEEDQLVRLPDAVASIEATLKWIVEHRSCQSSLVPVATAAT